MIPPFDLTKWVNELDAALVAAEQAAQPDPETQAAIDRLLKLHQKKES